MRKNRVKMLRNDEENQNKTRIKLGEVTRVFCRWYKWCREWFCVVHPVEKFRNGCFRVFFVGNCWFFNSFCKTGQLWVNFEHCDDGGRCWGWGGIIHPLWVAWNEWFWSYFGGNGWFFKFLMKFYETTCFWACFECCDNGGWYWGCCRFLWFENGA